MTNALSPTDAKASISQAINMTTYTYHETVAIARLPVQDIEDLIFQFIAITGEEKVPSNEALKKIIVPTIIGEYPKMEIGELVLALRNGVTGKYGPLYKSIGIDTIPTWVRKYYEVTWPEIERAAELQNRKEKKIIEALPVSEEILAEFKRLRKITELRAKQQKEASYKYSSIEDFCKRHKINEDAYLDFIWSKCTVDTNQEEVMQEMQIKLQLKNHLQWLRQHGYYYNLTCNIIAEFGIKFFTKQ